MPSLPNSSVEALPGARPLEEQLLRPDQVAAKFNVSPRTVTYWAWRGKLPFVRTPGGHYRFRPSDVDAQMNGLSE